MSRNRSLHLSVLFLVCASWACEKVPLTSPTGSTIALSTNSNIVPVNGSAEVTATVTESAGTAVQNGTTVIFTSDFGRMDPAEAKTQNGRATVRFVASGQSGTVKVNAYSGAASTSSGATSGALTLLVGGAAAGRITVRAEPPTIPQAGGTTQIFASVADTNGNPLSGAPVTFTIGGASGTGVLGSPSTVTDARGQAQTSLTTNQTTTVTATVATTTTSSVTANVVVSALPAPTVTITSCTPSPAVGVAVNCTVTPVPAGGAAIQNVTVSWGDGTGEQPYGNITGATVVSHTYASPSTYTITASATDLNSQRGTAVATVVVTRSIPSITITGPTTGTVGTSVSFQVTPPASTSSVPTSNVSLDFGDGTTRNLGAITASTSVNKTYSSAGNYIVSATVTDNAGTRNTTSTSILISGSAGPGVSLSQTGTLSGGCGSFTLTLTPIAGTTIQSGSVKLDRTGGDVHTGTGSTTFAACTLLVNDVLTARYTDSNGKSATTQLLVK